MDDGFYFEELTEFKQDLIKSVKELYPKETKKFIKDEAKKLTKKTQAIAGDIVKTTGKNGNKSYHKQFKTGKTYKYYGDDICCRAYNSSPHAHLIENGHKNKDGSFTLGRYPFKIAQTEFKGEFEKDCDTFLGQYVDDTVNGKL
jgi:hypothetical protein